MKSTKSCVAKHRFKEARSLDGELCSEALIFSNYQQRPYFACVGVALGNCLGVCTCACASGTHVQLSRPLLNVGGHENVFVVGT